MERPLTRSRFDRRIVKQERSPLAGQQAERLQAAGRRFARWKISIVDCDRLLA
jgi:hypothetical protein